MSNRQGRGSTKPTGTRRFERGEVIWASIRGIHQGQRQAPRKKAGHMDANLTAPNRDPVLAPEGPSTHGIFDRSSVPPEREGERAVHHITSLDGRQNDAVTLARLMDPFPISWIGQKNIFFGT